MIKAIVFDFDGVLVESAQLKTEAFREVFSEWPEKTEAGVSYHLKNMGISRYVKFKHFYENILCEPYTEEIGEALGSRFSGIVLEKVKKAPLVKGTEDFFRKNRDKYLCFIASGTPQQELDDIVFSKGLGKYFKRIFGAPATKTEMITAIMTAHNLTSHEVVFVGDAESDMKAAREAKVHFVLRVTSENSELASNITCSIEDLEQLESKIEEITRG